MDEFEIKNLPLCTWIGYRISLAVQRSWNKLSDSLRNFRYVPAVGQIKRLYKHVSFYFIVQHNNIIVLKLIILNMKV